MKRGENIDHFVSLKAPSFLAMSSQKSRVIDLYKTLLYLGRDYPSGYSFFRTRLKNAFAKNRNVRDPEIIEKCIAHGQFVVKEIEALYMLKKYRTLKRRYGNEETVIPCVREEGTDVKVK